MLRISQRSEYAIRAMLELSLRGGRKPVTVAEIAHAQEVPAKFLSAILAQLRLAGVVESLRGMQGGYVLARPPHSISVGEVVRLMDGAADVGAGAASLAGSRRKSVFDEVREEIKRAVERVLDGETFASLVERETRRRAGLAANYSI